MRGWCAWSDFRVVDASAIRASKPSIGRKVALCKGAFRKSLEKPAAGGRRSQGQSEDDQRRDGHDPGLAADYRERDQPLALLRQRVEIDAGELAFRRPG